MDSIKRTVESLEKWEILKAYFKENDYFLWQMQYGYNQSEGFHAWFWKDGKPQVEVITHIKDIENDIVKYISFK